MLQLLLRWLDVHWKELSALCYLLLRIWLLNRKAKWQRELLAREQRRHIAAQNETVKMLSTAYATEEPLTLDDLLSRAERDFSLRSSEKPSETSQMRPRPPANKPRK